MPRARKRPVPLSNAEAVEATIGALESAGRVTEEAAAIVAAARSLAAMVDVMGPESPGAAGVWREYRTVLVELGKVGAGVADDDTAAFLLTVTTPRLRG